MLYKKKKNSEKKNVVLLQNKKTTLKVDTKGRKEFCTQTFFVQKKNCDMLLQRLDVLLPPLNYRVFIMTPLQKMVKIHCV